MRCPQCAAEVSEGARFCSGCGGKIRVTLSDQVPKVLAFSCYRCGQTLPPQKYFSRGMNVAKLVALLPINFVLPILFFFVRRDRLICTSCKKLLPDTAPRALLPMGSQGMALLPAMPVMPLTGGSLALMPQQPAAVEMERRSRKARARGIGLGVMSIPFSMGTIAAMMGDAGLAATAVVATPGALLITGAVTALRRAGSLKEAAREVEEKQQRQRILQLARQREGRLSVADVAASLNMDIKDAEHLLDSLVDGRHVDVHVTEAGRLIYVFPDLENARQSNDVR
ncbi:MAG: zinc ribbon domain-containing protein [Deltaproteobacteria bacterium]|nr:zinc ribbon domain-containing protein [Deltaproteobacteria bacterium]